jgi:hypothetical protein
MSSSKLSKEFNQLILEAVDESLSILGGEPVKRAFYYHLEKRAKIKCSEIPVKLQEFHNALTGLFDDGASILERRISRCLYERLDLELTANNGWTLADYVREARIRYESL